MATKKNQEKDETSRTVAGIHALYECGKIDRDTHNLWCEMARDGATSFEL